jgi:uncharacterized protein
MLSETLSLPAELRPIVDEMVRRIVEVADPVAVVLFGSYARGTARPDSDVDLLVIADTPDPGELAADLYELEAVVASGRERAMPAFDLVPMTPDKWLYDQRLPAQLARYVRHDGVTLYGRLP